MENVSQSSPSLLQNKTFRIIFFIIVLCLIGAIILLNGSQREPTSPQDTTSQGQNLVPQISPSSNKAEGQIIVKFKEGISDEVINQRLQSLDARIKEHLPGIQATVVSVTPGQEDAVTQALANDPLVQYAEPDYLQTVQFVPNDTYYKNQWGLANSGQTYNGQQGTVGADISIESAWDVSRGVGVKVAVIDTGIDMSHPDLASKVVAQKIFTTNSIADKFGHGTHVAGVIAATTNNSQGIAGTCPDCQLLIAKAMNDSGIGQNSVLSEAVVWAVDNGAKVINMSEGGNELSQAQADAVAYAWEKGAIVVAAAGNDGKTGEFYPAALPNVLSVASVDNQDKKSSFSNYGPWVNVAAPGSFIFSTLPTTPFAMQEQDPLALSYDYLSGTSMATPLVSGVVALVWASPFGTSKESVLNRMLTTAEKIPGTGQYWENGRVDASAAVGPAAATTAPVPTTQTTTAPQPSQSIITPTLYCLGSCPTLPVTAAPVPSSGITGFATTAPGQTTTAPTAPGGIEPTKDPCVETSMSRTATWGHDHHERSEGWISRMFRLLLELLIEIIRLILGGGVPSPTPTNPCEPSVTEAPVVTIAPQATVTQSVAPTTGNEPTVPETNPTVAPTGTGGEGESATASITFYGSYDNDPKGSLAIANPVIHQQAGGTGTFADPLTFASPAGDGEYPFGTIIYVPRVQKYFIREDECAVSWTAPNGCGAVTMVDLYVGNPSSDIAVLECEGALTTGPGEIIIDPPANLTYDPTPIWDQSTGVCMTPHN